MRLGLLLCVTVCAASAAAADTFGLRPESCERAATARYDDCSVVNIFRCSGGPAAFWIESLDRNNILTVETRNADHGSLSLDYVGQDMSMRLTQSKAHPRDTIRNGSASDTIEGEITMFGMVRPMRAETRYVHAGETSVVAGESFSRITYAGTVIFPPPVPETSGDGSVIYSERLDLLIEESSRYKVGGVVDAYNLAHRALPGQDGFGEETPVYRCGELSGLPPAHVEARA